MTENTVRDLWEDPRKPKKRVIQELMHDYAPNYDLNEGDSELYNDPNSCLLYTSDAADE